MGTSIVYSQILLENSYEGYVQSANLQVKGPVFYAIDFMNNQCNLFNPDHTIWKTIGVVPPGNKFIYDVHHVSQHLFNTDDLVEMAVEFYEYKIEDTVGYYEYTTEVINEEGSVLLSVDGGAFPQVFKITENTAKLSVFVYDYYLSLTPVSTNIYSIPGIPSAVQTNEWMAASGSLGIPYPNPVSNRLTIPANFTDRQGNGRLFITDELGHLMKCIDIQHSSPRIEIDVANFKAGTYLYWFETKENRSETRKFIVE
jgi:hypothetical protein